MIPKTEKKQGARRQVFSIEREAGTTSPTNQKSMTYETRKEAHIWSPPKKKSSKKLTESVQQVDFESLFKKHKENSEQHIEERAKMGNRNSNFGQQSGNTYEARASD